MVVTGMKNKLVIIDHFLSSLEIHGETKIVA